MFSTLYKSSKYIYFNNQANVRLKEKRFFIWLCYPFTSFFNYLEGCLFLSVAMTSCRPAYFSVCAAQSDRVKKQHERKGLELSRVLIRATYCQRQSTSLCLPSCASLCAPHRFTARKLALERIILLSTSLKISCTS